MEMDRCHVAPLSSVRSHVPVPRVEPIELMRELEWKMNRIARQHSLGPLVGSAVEVRPDANIIVTYNHLGGRILFDDDACVFTIVRPDGQETKVGMVY
jgi:hypothetical protein